MSDLLRDLRHALRALRNNPGFTLAAVVTLALGLGANTTIFSAVHAVLLEKPPYPAPGELHLVTAVFDRGVQPPDTKEYWSYPMYQAFRGAVAGMGEFAAFTPTPRRVYEISPSDPMTFAAVMALLGGVAAVAIWLLARRAARIVPMEALHHE
jgi:hypothetical protein